jgi:hypothetical protein
MVMFFRRKRSEQPTLPAKRCVDHSTCIVLHREDGSIREAGWWHARWIEGSWHLMGPDPADSGFGELGGPVDLMLAPGEGEEPLSVLVPYLGLAALAVPFDLLPTEQGPAAMRPAAT